MQTSIFVSIVHTNVLKMRKKWSNILTLSEVLLYLRNSGCSPLTQREQPELPQKRKPHPLPSLWGVLRQADSPHMSCLFAHKLWSTARGGEPTENDHISSPLYVCSQRVETHRYIPIIPTVHEMFAYFSNLMLMPLWLILPYALLMVNIGTDAM